MFGKFRSPLLSNVEKPAELADAAESKHPAKRRRVSDEGEQVKPRTTPRLIFKKPGISSLPRKPLLVVPNPAIIPQGEPTEGGVEGYYNVLW